MPRLPEEFLRRLQDANDIVDLFSSYVTLKKQGRDYVCCCPFHSEKTPSCHVHPDEQYFHCFGCGAGGTIFTFIQKIENVEFMDAVRILAQRSGTDLPQMDPQEQKSANLRRRCLEINRETARIYFANLIKGSDPRGMQYFRERQLSMDIIKKYGLGYAPDDWGQLRNHLRKKGYSDDELVTAGVCRRSDKGAVYDYFRNRVMFPIIDVQGNVIAFGGRVLDDSKPKYLNTNDTPVFRKKDNLFSMNFARKASSTTLILAEGYMDVIALHQAGFTNAIATLGTSITSEQARIISRYAKQVVIAYDSDGAGQDAIKRAIGHFDTVGIPVRVLRMEGAKDPDEYIKKFGAEQFRLCVHHAEDAIKFLLNRCKEGLDLQIESGQDALLRRSIQVLAGISNSVTRDLYINTVANEMNIRVEVLRTQVDNAVEGTRKKARQVQFHAIEAQSLQRDELNPEAQQFPKESRAERLILAYLLQYPEDAATVQELVQPEDFVTEFHRRMYESICRHIQESKQFQLLLLAEVFSADEMGRIASIVAENKDTLPDQNALAECADVLKKARNRANSGSDLTDDDLRRLVQNRQMHG